MNKCKHAYYPDIKGTPNKKIAYCDLDKCICLKGCDPYREEE